MSNTHPTDSTQLTEKKALNSGLNIGDILYSSWGYEQSNVNFYQVTKKIGLTMVELREIQSKSIQVGEYHSMTDHVVPAADQFKEGKSYPTIRRKVFNQNCVRVSDCEYAFLNDKKYHFRSSYA